MITRSPDRNLEFYKFNRLLLSYNNELYYKLTIQTEFKYN